MTIDALLKTNVNNHTEKKNGLTYLSWAWAWAEVLMADPKASFKVEMFGDKCFMDINGTSMVWVTVTMFDKPITCQLPVMDYRNKAIPKPDAFQVNTAIMRCLTKAIGLHGLGLYIYAGEDLPEDDDGNAANKQKTPTTIIPASPKTETLGLTDSELSHITDMAQALKDMVADGAVDRAFDMVIDAKLEEPQMIALNNMLDSKTRSTLRAVKEARKAKK
jgi:Protein of unknown function (DUF1071)